MLHFPDGLAFWEKGGMTGCGFRGLMLLILLVNFSACGPVYHRGDHSISKSGPPSGKETANVDVRTLCERLKEIKAIPYEYGMESDDPVYNGLAARKNEAIPCLIDKITDATRMKDPMSAPKFSDFRVGDAAVFLLLMFTGEQWQPDSMLAPEYADKWEQQGVYAYFRYVENSENRKHIQTWWKDWADKNLETVNRRLRR